MYQSIKIDNFRAFDHITFEGFGTINIFLGDNNSGKTSALEAIFCHACGSDIAFMLENMLKWRPPPEERDGDHAANGAPAGGRRLDLVTAEMLFNYFHTVKDPCEFKLNAKTTRIQLNVTHRFVPNGHAAKLYPRVFGSGAGPRSSAPAVGSGTGSGAGIWTDQFGTWAATSASRNVFEVNERIEDCVLHSPSIDGPLTMRQAVEVYSQLEREGCLDEFVGALGQLFPEVEKLDALPLPDGLGMSVLVSGRGRRNIPLSHFGDGVASLFDLLGRQVVYQNAVHLFDEADVSLHPFAQKRIGALMGQWCRRFGNQAFMATHNLEFVRHFLHSLYEEEEDDGVVTVSVYTIRSRPDGDGIVRKVSRLDGKKALRLIAEREMDIR